MSIEFETIYKFYYLILKCRFVVDATSGELAKQSSASLFVNPVGLNDFTFSNETPVSIPDNNDTGIDSVITVADELTVFSTDASIDITHTYIGDLIVTLTSPQGTTATLHSQSGGGADDLVQSYSLANFNGEGGSNTPQARVSLNQV